MKFHSKTLQPNRHFFNIFAWLISFLYDIRMNLQVLHDVNNYLSSNSLKALEISNFF